MVSDKLTLHKPQHPHTITVRWEFHHGEPWPDFTISCPYDADDHDKPCRVWTDEYDNGVYQDGCWVLETFDATGIDCFGLRIPDDTNPPWDVYVLGSGDDPELTHVDLVAVSPCTSTPDTPS
jgi:hypothetical protein